MGGWGSGNRFRAGKRTVETSQSLDIRELKRKGLLEPGRIITSKWLRGGIVHSWIESIVYDDYLLLRCIYPQTDNISQKIYFTFTCCHYGGKRVWFQCPFCGRRCAVIYCSGKYFACRICSKLTYESCNATPLERRFLKADKLRLLIGAKPGAFNPLPNIKPKYMHRTTWVRIRDEIKFLELTGIVGLEKKLGLEIEDR